MPAACLLLFVALPVLALFANLSWSGLRSVLGDSQTQSAIKTSLVSTTVATGLLAVFGVPLGYILARFHFRGRGLIGGLIHLPLVLPPVVAGILLLLVWGQTGSLEQFLAPRNVYFVDQLSGIILCQMFVSAPFVVIAARSAFERVERDLEEAARTMGADTLRVFWSIALPLSVRAIMAGVTLAWMRAFGEFGATVVVAYHPYSFPVYLWVQFGSVGFAPVLPMALIAVVLGAIALLVAAALERLGLLASLVRAVTRRGRPA